MILWEFIESDEEDRLVISRTMVPGGWFVIIDYDIPTNNPPGVFFYPDPEHLWQPALLPKEEGGGGPLFPGSPGYDPVEKVAADQSPERREV